MLPRYTCPNIPVPKNLEDFAELVIPMSASIIPSPVIVQTILLIFFFTYVPIILNMSNFSVGTLFSQRNPNSNNCISKSKVSS